MPRGRKAPFSEAEQRASGRPIDEPTTEGSAGHTGEARTAFSYLRVSTVKQSGEERSGIDRQAHAFGPFCERHGLIPNRDPLVDRGISAYRGTNHQRGALGQFLDAARDGLIPPGSVLVVEDLDRFSREAPADALRLLLNDVFSHGIAIGVARFDSVISEHDFNRQAGAAIQLQMAIQMAHDFSRKLSERVSAAHDRTRAKERQGERVNIHWRPQWLDYDDATGAFTVNDRWPTYRRMIDLCLEGNGSTRTAQILNGEGHVNAHGGPWSNVAINQCWRDRRLIGERIYNPPGGEPEVHPGYFPAMLTSAEFQQLQDAVARRRSNVGRAGRGDRRHNLLQGFAVCLCGQRLELHTARKPSGRSHSYLVCKSKSRARGTGSCQARNVPYDEEAMLRELLRHEWRRYFDRPADNKRRRELERQVREQEGLLAQQRQHQATAEANLSAVLTRGVLGPEEAALLTKLATDARKAGDATEGLLAGLREQLRQAMQRPDGAAMQKQISERIESFVAVDSTDPGERIKFNNWLNTLGVTIAIYRDQHGRIVLDSSLEDLRVLGGDSALIERVRANLMENLKPPAAAPPSSLLSPLSHAARSARLPLPAAATCAT
jgi:DNA invertase Pin-like site-specific DNA recombinase